MQAQLNRILEEAKVQLQKAEQQSQLEEIRVKLLGKKGEAVAARYYLNQGYTLLEHNYQCRLGELDLILQKQELLVFAEVKTRRPGGLGTPAEAVNTAKQRRVVQAAKYYISRTQTEETAVRFDVVEVQPLPNGGWSVHCIPNAFLCE